jgi:hypothetical protein
LPGAKEKGIWGATAFDGGRVPVLQYEELWRWMALMVEYYQCNTTELYTKKCFKTVNFIVCVVYHNKECKKKKS